MRLALSLLFLLLALAACRRRGPTDLHADPTATPPAVAGAPAKASRDDPPPPTVATPAGFEAPAAKVTPAKAPTPAAIQATIDGEQLFQTNCAQCHMANGGGVPFMQPDIRHSAWISAESPQLLLSLILRGSVVLGEGAKAYDNDMPPFDHLSDAEIAALATRVREKFATPTPAKPVTPAEVATARARPGLPE